MSVEFNRTAKAGTAYSLLCKTMRTAGMSEAYAITYHYQEEFKPVVAVMEEIAARLGNALPEPEVLNKLADRLMDACDKFREVTFHAEFDR